MKMSKKILPALAMLIVSAVMLSTASFAWFALSEQVEADGMSVSIKSDSLYLLIAAVNEETAGGAANVETAVLTAEKLQAYKSGTSGPKVGSTSATGYAIGTTDIYPAAYYDEDFDGNGTDGIVEKGSDLKTVGKWYTATAASPDASDMVTGSDKALTSFDGYVVRYRYYVTLDVGSNAMDTLKISNLTIALPTTAGSATVLDPVRVIVACGDQKEEFDQGRAGTVDLTGNGSIDDQNALEIILYVYYDGNDSTVTTNDVAAISDAEITFTLKAENSSAGN